MTKKRIIIGFIIVALLSLLFLAYTNSQYAIVWNVNRGINVDGVRLMTTNRNVKRILGEEEEYVPGFGGYIFKYPSKGISLTFLNDSDTDFYNRVNKITITSSNYSIFGVRVGDDYENSVSIIKKKGFKTQKEWDSGFWKKNAYIDIGRDGEKVSSITIGVRDRVAGTRQY
jgi:hypothetical protein